MLQLLMHHVGRTDLTGISNCHVRGLHSVMLHDQDGNRVRIYCTTDGVDTNYNFIPTDEYIANEYGYTADNIHRIEMARQSACSGMTLGLHGHGTDIRLEVLAGSMYNITATAERNSEGGMRRYIHSSHITGDGTIRLAGGERWRPTNITQTRMRQGDNVYLEANTLHTVYVDGFCSWLVYERGPRINQNSHFFSYNTNAHRSDMSDMYQPMTSPDCQALLARVIAAYQTNITQQERAAAQARRAQERRDRLIGCKGAVEQARAYTPSMVLRNGRASDLRMMIPVTGAPRPANTIRLLSDADWAQWLFYVETLPEHEGLDETSFYEWATQIIDARLQTSANMGPSVPSPAGPSVEQARMNYAAEVEQYRRYLNDAAAGEISRSVLTSSRPGLVRRTTPTTAISTNSLSAVLDRVSPRLNNTDEIYLDPNS